MTSASVITRIKQELDDQGIFYTDTDIYDSLQDGYHDIALTAECIEKIVSFPTPTTPYYRISDQVPDYYRPFAIYDPNQKLFLTPTSVRNLDLMDDEWETRTGTVQYFVPIDFHYLAFYPTQSVSPPQEMYLFYFAQAPDFTSSNTLAIPSNCQSVIEDYVINDLLDQSLEFNKSQIHYQHYQEGVTRTTRMIQDRNLRDRIKHFLVINHVSLDR